MAKVILGPTIGMASGSIGAVVFSHNRNGTYIRRRATPTVSTTAQALAAKQRMTNASQAWRTLTAAEQTTWNLWAVQNPVVGSLGQPQALTGHQTYVMLHIRRQLFGLAGLTIPPIVAAPPGLTGGGVTADKTLGTCEITFTNTPLGAGVHLWVLATYIESNGVQYVKNLLKLIARSPAAQVSPWDAITAVEDRLGAMPIGQRLVIHVCTADEATGLISVPRRMEDTIV